MIRHLYISITCMAVFLAPEITTAQITVHVESGMVFSGYNDVRIPNNSGTLFSLSKDLSINPEPFVRIYLEYRMNRKHTLGLLIAPLSLAADGSVNKDVVFEGTTFPKDIPINGTYRFNSFRLTYHYRVWDKPAFQGALGFTAKIRNAGIILENNMQKKEKLNTGFVPLIYFSFKRTLTEKLSLVCEGDALASPQGQGRAEDVFLGFQYNRNRMAFRTGYRILEGGADVDEVYNFALLHYAVLGIALSF